MVFSDLFTCQRTRQLLSRRNRKERETNFYLTVRTSTASRHSNCSSPHFGGADWNRTSDPLLAKQVLSQLSYSPDSESADREIKTLCPLVSGYGKGCDDGGSPSISRAVVVRFIQNVSASDFLRKEVIQPHLPIRLPCYDFTPVIGHTVASALPKVKLPASGATNSHGVTGGVYKARERIHRSNADLRLLAIPTSRSRVADSDPD